jgi:hypothetical protein
VITQWMMPRESNVYPDLVARFVLASQRVVVPSPTHSSASAVNTSLSSLDGEASAAAIWATSVGYGGFARAPCAPDTLTAYRHNPDGVYVPPTSMHFDAPQHERPRSLAGVGVARLVSVALSLVLPATLADAVRPPTALDAPLLLVSASRQATVLSREPRHAHGMAAVKLLSLVRQMSALNVDVLPLHASLSVPTPTTRAVQQVAFDITPSMVAGCVLYVRVRSDHTRYVDMCVGRC